MIRRNCSAWAFTLARKVREWVLAKRLEENLSKEEILELYVNQIYFGHQRYGVQEAAQYYFGKNAEDLTLAEASLSFLGLGPGAAASWGALLDQGTAHLLHTPRIAMVAGETSGDLLAGLLLGGMRAVWPQLQAFGIGGQTAFRHLTNGYVNRDALMLALSMPGIILGFVGPHARELAPAFIIPALLVVALALGRARHFGPRTRHAREVALAAFAVACVGDEPECPIYK